MRTAPSTAPPLIESLGMLERAIGYTRLALMEVAPSMLAAPTPCADWDLGALLEHMADSLDALTEAADLGYVALVTPAGPASPVDAVERLRVKACSLLGSWSAVARSSDVLVGDKPLSSSLLACAGALEVTVHGWDVSVATGHPHPIPEPLARDLLPWVQVFVTDFDRPLRFGYRPDLGADADPSTRLLAAVGRQSSTATI